MFSTSKRVLAIAVAASCLAISIFFYVTFSIQEMSSDSMEPLISGEKISPAHEGDFVILTKWFSAASLRSGDLVAVEIPIPNGRVLTIREIDQRTNTPAGQFYLRAVNTNGIDSRQLGSIPSKDIRAKVIWVIKSN